MQALSQSSFLQALGYAIANSLWQAALLWLFLLFINSCFKLSSHNRYKVAITTQSASFTWFVVTLQYYYQQCIGATVNTQLLSEQNAFTYLPAPQSNLYSFVFYIARAEMLLPYLSLAYLCLLCVLAVRWFKSYRQAYQLKYKGLQKAGMEWRLFVDNMSAQLGIKQKVKIYLSTFVATPLTIGFLKPMILVPVATVNHLTTQQLEAVLLHELAHIRRADYLVNLLMNIIETLLFFNPFTRLISQTIQKEREHCCDDWVLQFQYNASMYAEALLRIACLNTAPAMAMKAAGQQGGELLWRIKRLLNQQQKKFSYSQQLIALAITTCILFSFALFQPATHSRQPLPQAEITKSSIVPATAPPVTEKIVNPLFNPMALLSQPIKEEVQKATAEIAKQDFDKLINTSLDAAGKALGAATPKVAEALNKLNAGKQFEQAKENAEKALAGVKWSSLKQLSPFIDSALITNSVKLALKQSSLYYNADKIKQSLAASQQQIDKLKQQHLSAYLNQDYVNTVIENSVNELNFDRVFKEAEKNTPDQKLKKPVKENKALFRQQEIILHRFMERQKAPEAEVYSYNIPGAEDEIAADSASQAFDWTYTNPVYKEPLPASLSNDEDLLNYIVQPVLENAPVTKPLMHIVKVSNKGHVNITIEIRQ